MTNKQKVEKLAMELGATIEISGGRYRVVVIEAPENHHWMEGCQHELVCESHPECAEGMGTVWQDMLGRMTFGIEPCTDECEWWEGK